MNLVNSVGRFVRAALGEQEISGRMPPHLDEVSGFVAVESSRRGYRIHRNGKKLTVKRVDPWAIATGLPPLYYFRGWGKDEEGQKMIEGRIAMSALPKCFILTWTSFVLVVLLGSLLWSLVLVSMFIVSQEISVDNSGGAGFLIGISLALALFGAALMTLVRAMSRRQKRKLILFCTYSAPQSR